MKPLLLMVLCWSCVSRIAAQEAPFIRHFTPEDYHFQNQNWSLTQSPDQGWLYAANNGGVMEFDGAAWTHWPLPDGQPARCVAVGADRRIYAGGFGAFGYWATSDEGAFRFHSLSHKVALALFHQEEIWHILPLPDKVLFQSFSTLYEYSRDTVRALQPPGSIMFTRWIHQRVLAPVIGQGIFELTAAGTFNLLPGTEIFRDHIVQFMVPGPNESIWIGTANAGLFVWKNGQCHAWDQPLNQLFKQNQLNKGLALSGGGWAFGTVLNGVYILDQRGALRYHLNRTTGLQNNTVLALMEDARHNLWAGLDKGIDLIELSAPLRYFNDQSGHTGTVYSAARQGNLMYIGTNQGLFVREQEGPFRLIEGTQGQVWQLKEKDGQLFCGHNSGTFLVKNRQVVKISTITGGWHFADVPGHPDMLLQSTYTGLVVYRHDPGKGWHWSHKVEGAGMPLKKIAFDANGYLWGVHPNKGLFRLLLNDSLTRPVEQRTFTTADGLPGEYRLDLTEMSSEVFLNSRKGVFQLETKGNETRFAPVALPVPEARYFPVSAKTYFLADSAYTHFCTQDQCVKIPLALLPDYGNILPFGQDNYLFCLENGYALLNVAALEERSRQFPSPAPVIRRVEVAGREIPLELTARAALAADEHTLSFHFAAPDFERPLWFSWRLDGFSSEWSPWQREAHQRFIHLPPGDYVFRVRTDQRQEEAVFRFRIAPPWYRTWWAWMLYIALATAGFWGLEWYNRRRWAHQKAILQAEKDKELERRQMVAEREKLSIEVDNKSRELSNAAFNLIRKNEALQHLKDTLLDRPDDPNLVRKIVRRIDEHLEGDHDWEVFEEAFNRVHDNFFARLLREYPDMTQGDLRLAAYLRMNLSSKEMAPLLNMSLRGVENKRYRLRKKLGLPETANLAEFLINY